VSAAVDILAIAAHPDDAEIGCGGALILAADAGLRVAVADLTSGEMATSGTLKQREEERARAAGLLGLCDRIAVGLPDTRIGMEPSHRDAIIALIRDTAPRIVLAPYPDDRHPDHAAAGRLVRDACFYAGVAKLGAGAPHRPRRLYHYMLHHSFEPSFVLDVSAVWTRRMAAVTAYDSQLGAAAAGRTEIGGGDFLEQLSARAGFFGAMIGVQRGEPFYCRGPVAASILPGASSEGADSDLRYRMFL
jgi:bacillithiol biosynthesis deacetylase BshB1